MVCGHGSEHGKQGAVMGGVRETNDGSDERGATGEHGAPSPTGEGVNPPGCPRGRPAPTGRGRRWCWARTGDSSTATACNRATTLVAPREELAPVR